jgi:hypothetical protein
MVVENKEAEVCTTTAISRRGFRLDDLVDLFMRYLFQAVGIAATYVRSIPLIKLFVNSPSRANRVKSLTGRNDILPEDHKFSEPMILFLIPFIEYETFGKI